MRAHTQLGRLSVRALIAFVALATVAPVTGTSPEPEKRPTAAGPPFAGAPRRTPQSLIPPTANNAVSTPMTYRARKKRTTAALDKGNPLFVQAVSYAPGGTDALSVAVADVNHDGKVDLLVAAFSDISGETGPAGVLLGNGDGTFQQAATYDSGGQWSVSVAVADVDGDGKLDLAVADYASGTVGVLLGNGDGTFRLVSVNGSGGAFPKSVAVGDVNGDGKPDLIVANCGTNTCEDGLIGVLLGNGDGTFQPVVIYGSGGLWATSVAVADVNQDGKLDLVVSNAASGTVAVLLGKGDGTFLTAATYSSGESGCAQGSGLAVTDVNGDGRLDVLVTNYCARSVVGVLLGNGDGTFQPAAVYDTGGAEPISVAVGDIDEDGKPDLAVANSGSNAVAVLLGNGDGTFQPASTYGTGAEFVAIADVNGDGRPDLVAAGKGAVNVLLNNTGPHVPTTTTLISNENPVQPEVPITYTATVMNQGGNPPTGTITFQDLGTTIATVQLTGNQAAYNAFYTKVGTHPITATYSGDLHNSVSQSATLTEYVLQIPIPTKTMLNTSGSPSFVGMPVTFTAMVTWSKGTAPDGELVTFSDGPLTLASVPLAGGMAAYSTSSLTDRTHRIKATYAGEIRFTRSSGLVTQVVNGYPTRTTFSSSLNPSVYGQRVTFTAMVTTAGAVLPTGRVAFTWGGVYTIGSAALNSSGLATLTKSNLNADPYALTAVYSGDTNNLSSTSAVLNQVVLETTSTATLTSSPNPSTQGQAVTFTAKIVSPTVIPSGPVTFTVGNAVLGTAQLSSGKAKFTTSTLPVGSSKVTATYYGDSNIAKSSASVIQTVQ